MKNRLHLSPFILAGAVAFALLAAPATAQQFRPHRISDQIQNTACEVGPDGHLYVVSMNYHDRTGSAKLTRYPLDEQGHPTGQQEVVYDWGAESPAQPIGLAVDPDATRDNLIFWIALGESLQGHSGWSDPWAGRIYRLAVPANRPVSDSDLELKITNLPHAFHTVNDITFGPDRNLYICVGSATTLGWEPHAREQLLSGAILQADVRSIEGTLDVKTADGGDYNPFLPDAPVKLFSTAIRQAYDCVWHPNGRLYACNNQNDVNGQTGAGGGIPDVRNARPPEFLAIMEKGRTYGFPNAARGEFVLMGGNPTSGDDGWTEIDDYPVGIEPPSTFDADLLYRIDDIGGGSADGILAYRAQGPLQGSLITCFYSTKRIYTFAPGPDGRIVKAERLRDHRGEPLEIDRPLDICEHPTLGHLYVAAYGQQDKGEGGAVYFLARTGPAPEQPKLASQPVSFFEELPPGSVKWSDWLSIRANRPGQTDYSLKTASSWLNIEPPHGVVSGDAPEQRHQLELARALEPGTHYARIQLLDGEMELGSIGVQIHVASPGSQNRFSVSAGNWRDVVAKKFPAILPLNGTVISSSTAPNLETEWSLEAGAAEEVMISSPGRLNTKAILNAPGRYRIKLTARQDGEVREDSVLLIVDVPGNEPPNMNLASPKNEVRVEESVQLVAKAQDDGLPRNGSLSYRWSREGTGSGLVWFSDPQSPETEVRFQEPGNYRIRCTVSDGVRESWEETDFKVVRSAGDGARRATATDQPGQ